MVGMCWQGLGGRTSWFAGMKMEEGGCWSSRFLRWYRGCSLGQGRVVGRSVRKGGEGVCGVRIVSAVA
jgi:hypothetical protein